MLTQRYRSYFVVSLTLLCVALLSGCFGTYYSATHADDAAKDAMAEGQRYYKAGDYARAEQAFGHAYSMMRKARNDCVTGADCRITNDALIKYYIAYNLSMRAICRLHLNKLGGAENDASLALEYDPGAPIANYAMALVHLAYGEYSQARSYQQRLAAMSRNSSYSADERHWASVYAQDLAQRLSGR